MWVWISRLTVRRFIPAASAITSLVVYGSCVGAFDFQKTSCIVFGMKKPPYKKSRLTFCGRCSRIFTPLPQGSGGSPALSVPPRSAAREILFFFGQKQMNAFSYRFTFCYAVLFAVVIQFPVCLRVQPNRCSDIYRVLRLWPSGAWAHVITSLLSTHELYFVRAQKSIENMSYTDTKKRNTRR